MTGRWSVTVNDLVRQRAGDPSTGLRYGEQSWPWDEHTRLAAQRAAFLEARRERNRPFHIGVLPENVPEFSFLLAAAAVSGAVFVGLNPTRHGAELARDVEHTDCALLITGDPHLARLREALPHFPAARLINVDDPTWRDALAPYAGAPLPDAAPAPDDPYMLILTSGTTGHPRAVICSQGKIATLGRGVVAMQRLTDDDVAYCAMPLFHSNAMITCWTPAVASGATLVPRRRFSASEFLPDVRRYGVTYANYVGRPLAYILATPEQPDDADNMLTRVFGNEGGPQDVERFARRFGCAVCDGFGSTEGGLSFMPVEGMPPGALGRANGDIRILAPETREECPPGRFDAAGRLLNADEAVGELVNLDGAGAFEGYWNNADATADRLREGWYWSGDLASRDADGLVFFAGRGGEWVRVGGENFARHSSRGSSPVTRTSCWRRCTGCPTRRRATRPWRRSCCAKAPASTPRSSRRGRPPSPTCRPPGAPATSASPTNSRTSGPTRPSPASWPARPGTRAQARSGGAPTVRAGTALTGLSPTPTSRPWSPGSPSTVAHTSWTFSTAPRRASSGGSGPGSRHDSARQAHGAVVSVVSPARRRTIRRRHAGRVGRPASRPGQGRAAVVGEGLNGNIVAKRKPAEIAQAEAVPDVRAETDPGVAEHFVTLELVGWVAAEAGAAGGVRVPGPMALVLVTG